MCGRMRSRRHLSPVADPCVEHVYFVAAEMLGIEDLDVPEPVRIVLSLSPRNMKAKNPPTRSRPATPPPTISSVITVRRRLRNTLRNASSKNLPISASFCSAVRYDLSVRKAYDVRGVLQQSLVVRGEDKSQAQSSIELAHQFNQLSGVARVQIRRGFIGQHQRGPMDNRTRHCDPLPFAAREQVGAVTCAIFQADAVQRLGNSDRPFARAETLNQQGNSTFSAAVKTGIRLKV